MNALPITAGSAWSANEITSYLQSAPIPLRLACNDHSGFPLLCSLWFHFDGESLWCVTHQNAYVIQRLRADSKCAFEIGENSVPYKGVRGQGRVSLQHRAAADLLPQMIDHYLGARDSQLAHWLLGRIDEEVAVKIAIERITAWDYSKRMAR